MKTSALRLIRNNRAVLKLAPKRGPNNLPAPINVADTEAIARAKSLVVATRGHVDISAEEAREILKQHGLTA